MTTAQDTPRSWESTMTAELGGPDSRDIPNEIHSTDGAKDYGYTAALVGGATVFAVSFPSLRVALKSTPPMSDSEVKVTFPVAGSKEPLLILRSPL